MRLLIVRHAIAAPRGEPGVPDDERALTPRGVQRFEAAAAGLAALLKPAEVVFTSPLRRARQTAELLAAAWRGTRVVAEPALATGDFAALARALDARAGRRLVAVVGHEPHVSATLARVLGGARDERLAFRKGGAALVDLPGSLDGGGQLVWFLPPRVLRRLG